MKVGKVQSLAVLGVAVLLGFVIAGGRLTPSGTAHGEQKASPAVEKAQAKPVSLDKLDRTVLPIPEPKVTPSTVLDVRNAKAPPHFEVKAPAGAPNVLIVLIDDMGFGQSSAFGGPIHMPTVEHLAKGGSNTISSTRRRCAHPHARHF